MPPSSVTNHGNHNALTQFLGQAVRFIQDGDLAEAAKKLADAIARTDGCAANDVADGNGPSRDWITSCGVQEQIYPPLVAALTAITQ